MQKLNEYFGLETNADCIWFYGFYTVASALFLINMRIAHVLWALSLTKYWTTASLVYIFIRKNKYTRDLISYCLL
ncbi:hypothetical protein ICS_05695 [Bacillus cereus BAG2O-3]|nr:hypothetical protein ICS_05695 [Bacillus cereus BAG2O-3]